MLGRYLLEIVHGRDAWLALTAVEIKEAVEVSYPRLEARV